MAKKFKKWLAMCLAVSLCMSLFTVQASAAENKCDMAEHTHGVTCYSQVIDTTKCTKHMCDSEECEIAADLDLICTKEVHTHTVEAGCYHKHSISGDCYELTCTKEAGQLDCGMTEESTICGIEAADCALTHDHEEGGCNGHTHIATCYHSHTDACNHTHADGCYATSPKCGKTEDVDLICTKDVHSHGNTVEQTCYEPHAHKDACYKTELTCTAEEHTHVAGCEYGLGVVALVGEIPYTTLKAAVAAANATEGGATIELLDNITLSEKLTITGNVAIKGAYTITRASDNVETTKVNEAYTGTMVTVNAGAKLVLNGVVIDGGNNWYYDEEAFKNAALTNTNVPKGSTIHPVTLEAGAPVATAAVFAVNGTLELTGGATVQNNAGASIFCVYKGGHLVMGESKVAHNYKGGSSAVVDVDAGGKWTVNDGAEITQNYSRVGNGGVSYMRGTTIVNGGSFTRNAAIGNGMIFQVYGSSAYLEINGGTFSKNYCLNNNGDNYNGVVYVQSNGKFTMNGGTITGNYGSDVGGISTKADGSTTASIIINGGNIVDNYGNGERPGKDSVQGHHNTIGGDVKIDSSRYFRGLTVTAGNTLTGDVYFHGWKGAQNYNGEGTINGNVTLYGNADVTINSGSWLSGMVTVNAVGNGSTLIVKPEATINGTQVRVLDSVTSGDYLNVEEATAAQADSYVNEGGNVVSPVLYYHRLSSDQKKDIVVTFDYNGGLDASGWSGSQITSAETFTPATPVPTNGSLKLAGWAYAVDNDPESLSMADDGDYSGEEIAQSVRLIAQWTKNTGNRPNNDRPSNNRPSGGSDLEEIEEIEVPLAGGPLWLNTTDHNAYLNGFGDGTLRPYDGITRGQVATIFFRLLTDEARAMFWSETNDFTDCGEDLWCNTAISTLSNMGIISGYEDGTFRPDVKVTRAQFAKIMVGFFGVDQFGYTGLFSDVAEDAWHSRYVETASRLGLIQGYSNGIFNPNANITRAQACVIVNRALVRIADEEHLLPLDEMLTWSDNTPDDWFYADMMEATNSHDYLWLDTETDIVEQWTEKLEQPDWAELEKLWSEIYGG